MALLEWRDEFRTGIAGVDHEHEELIAREVLATSIEIEPPERQEDLVAINDRAVWFDIQPVDG